MPFMSIGDVFGIKVHGLEYRVRAGIILNGGTSLNCQFFSGESSKLIFEVVFHYNFLQQYDYEVFSYHNIYTKDGEIPYEAIKPFLRYSIKEFIERIRKGNGTEKLEIDKGIGINILDEHRNKQCDYFDNYKCTIADMRQGDEGHTTEKACAGCLYPEYFEKCSNIIGGKTSALDKNGALVRTCYKLLCKRGHEIDDIRNCSQYIKECYIPLDLYSSGVEKSHCDIFISSRCKEFESDRLVLKDSIEKDEVLSDKTKVVILPESDDHIPDSKEIDTLSLEKAYGSQVYILLLGKEYAEIVEKEFYEAKRSLSEIPNKQIWVYVKNVEKREERTDAFISYLKGEAKLPVKEFKDIIELKEQIIRRTKMHVKN